MIAWRQVIVAALVIAFVSAAAVWFLEDFQRRALQSTMRDEWARWLAELPVRGPDAA